MINALFIQRVIQLTGVAALMTFSGIAGVDLTPAPVPVLTWNAETPEYVQALSENLGNSYEYRLRNFRELLIEKNEILELYPFLPYIFFDGGSAEFVSRYNVVGDTTGIGSFSEQRIPGGAFQKYYHILNILGSRMRLNPTSTITLIGCNSRQPQLGETRVLSQQRAEQVQKYLVGIWSIDPKRIRVVARDLPQHASDNNDERGREENRRVEITSDDWEIMKIIVQHEIRQFPQPEMVTFGMKNGIADEDVASRRIEVLQDGKLWHVLSDSVMGLTSSESPGYNWGKWGNEDSLPETEAPYIARLIVRSRNGVEYRSAAVTIPVEILTRDERYSDCTAFPHVNRYALQLFDFNRSDISSLNERILREYILKSIPNQAKISVTGYTEDPEPEKSSLQLSTARALAVVRQIRKYGVLDSVVSLEGRGIGSEGPLYSDNYPEGRCLNRTVQVVMQYPRKEWGEQW